MRGELAGYSQNFTMDFQFFVDTLKRHLWLLIGASLLAGVASVLVMVYLVEPKYTANTQVDTGIVNYKDVSFGLDAGFVGKLQVDQAFAQLITDLQGRQNLGKLTEILLRHDLTSETPFREPEAEELADLGATRLDDVRRVLVSRGDSLGEPVVDRGPLVSTNGLKLNDLAEAYGYDFDELRKYMIVSRVGETDYLNIGFTTTDPALSYFMVSEYVKLFIDDYGRGQNTKEQRVYEFFKQQVSDKRAQIDSLQSLVDAYKNNRAVVDLDEQKRAVVTQMKEIELEIEETRKRIRGLENALQTIRADRLDAGRRQGDRRSRLAKANAQLEMAQSELADLTNRLSEIDGGDDGLRQLIADKRREVNDYAAEVATMKRLGDDKVEDRITDLRQQELEAQIDLEAARRAVESMEAEVMRLRGRSAGLVDDEAYLAALQSDVSIRRNEEVALLENLEEARQTYDRGDSPLTVVEPPEFPEEHESRNIPIVAAFSAVSTGTLVALGLFLVTLLDRRLRSPDQLRALYQREAIAILTKIKVRKFSLRRLFNAPSLPEAPRRWIEGIRSLRYELEHAGRKVIQVTSLTDGAGKSSVAAGVARALTRANEKVLLVDLNFKDNTLSAYANVGAVEHPFEINYDEGKLPRANGWYELEGMDIVGNLGGNRSLAEVLSGVDFAHRLDLLRRQYDYIVIEAASLGLYADSRELAEHVDGIICILDADERVDGAGREGMTWLESQGDRFLGYVLNRVDLKMLS